MDEKASLVMKNMTSNQRVRHNSKDSESSVIQDVSTMSCNLQLLFNYKLLNIHYNENYNLVEDLKKWSDRIHCPSLLILDNCDDILVSSSRDSFVDLVYSLISHSHNLHVIIVSMKKLFLLNSFKYLTVANLSLSASISFLDQLITPVIDNSYMRAVSESVEGNPLALKIIGKLLDFHGEHLVREITKQLNQAPLNALDKASIRKEKFRSVLDTAFTRLGELKTCGYILGLFPGSFDENASKAVISAECFEVYKRYSLLDEYHLARHYRYKLHRLIREYVKEKLKKSDEIWFNKKFDEYYQEFLLDYVTKSGLNADERYSLSLEVHNFNHLKVLLLQDKPQSEAQLAVLVFLAKENYLHLERLHEYFNMYMDKLNNICRLLSPATCGDFYLYVIKYAYQDCKCETLAKYVQNLFIFSCDGMFKCTIVNQIANICQDIRYDNVLCTQLPPQERTFITLIGETCNYCGGYYGHNVIIIFIACCLYLIAVVPLLFITVKRQHERSLLWFFTLIVYSPLYYLISVFFIIHVPDFMYVLHLFTELSASRTLFIQTVSRKLCPGLTIILIWCMLLVCTLKVYYKIKKDLTLTNIAFCLITFLLGFSISSIICKIQLFVCQFLPICV